MVSYWHRSGMVSYRLPHTDLARIPRMIVQVSVGVEPHDVVHADRPRYPADVSQVRFAVVGVEQPPAPHVHLLAISRADMQVWSAGGARDDPGSDCRACEYLGEQSPDEIEHRDTSTV